MKQSEARNEIFFQMCKVIGCDNGCECKRLDSSLINRHCEYNCDFECTNKNNTFHLGKRCQFAQPTLNCNSGLIVNNNILINFNGLDSIVIEVQKDVVVDKWPLSKALVYNGLGKSLNRFICNKMF